MRLSKTSGNAIMVVALLSLSMFLTCGLSAVGVEAASNFYTEDFTTTTYLDGATSNVTGWGNGNISSPHRAPSLVSAVDTQGLAYDVCIVGQLAYVPTWGAGVRIINVSDPYHPVEIGHYDAISNAINIDVEGDIAYVAGYNDGLVVLNVSDPTSPTLLGSFVAGGYDYEVVADGNLVYAGWGGSTGQAGLRIINVTNPMKPTHVLFYDNYNTYPRNIVVDGDLAYLSCETYALHIMNVTNPRQPEMLDVYIAGVSHARGLAVEGDHLYLTGAIGGFQVLNVTNPWDASVIAAIGPSDTAGVAIDGNYAYIGTGYDSGISIINITNPMNPVQLWHNATPGYVRDLKVAGEYLYVADNDAGLRIYKIADREEPELISELPGEVRALQVVGDTAYTLDADGGQLRIVNITDVTNPQFLGSYTSFVFPFDLCVQGDIAYVVDQFLGLQVLNVSNPMQPVLIGGLGGGDRLGIEVEGNFAYIADYSSGLEVVNITDPSHPQSLGHFLGPHHFISLDVRGNYAYMADTSNSFLVVNITNPRSPSITGICTRIDVASESYGIEVGGNYAYLTDLEGGLIAINIANPHTPFKVFNDTTTANSTGIALDGDYLYVSCYYSGLYVYDVGNPSMPVMISYYEDSEGPMPVEASGEHAFVGTANSLQILEIEACRPRQYESVAIGQSTSVLEIDGSFSQMYATLSVTQEIPASTSVTYYLSANNGTTWEAANPGVAHAFSHFGNNIKWRAMLATSDPLTTASIYSLSIEVSTTLQSPVLLTPGDGTGTSDATPTLTWTDNSGAVSYLLQIDESPLFDSAGLQNITVIGATTYIPNLPLADGAWYWRVAANDTDGDLGVFSETRSFTIDTTPPGIPTLLAPENGSIQTNSSRTFGWIHPSEWYSYVVQFDRASTFDTPDLRTITGLQDSVYSPSTPFADGLWYWRVSAVDSVNNHGAFSEPWTVIFDTSTPSWNAMPTDQILEYGNEFRYQLTATDPNGTVSYRLNNTVRFGISSNGTVYNIGRLPVGEYGLEVAVTDLALHTSRVSFTVTVRDTTSPTWINPTRTVVLDYDEPLDVQLTAMDLSGIAQYSLSDSANFSIDATGRLTNHTTLNPGSYLLTVSARDPYGNAVDVIVTITVHSSLTTEPLPDYVVPIIVIGSIVGVCLVAVVIYLKRKS